MSHKDEEDPVDELGDKQEVVITQGPEVILIEEGEDKNSVVDIINLNEPKQRSRS